ncbi:MAG: penicillin-insensitive murein endopeptidase [Deltaproteobacteria bacterium]|nr:penicillin-insensitive murein endopeptidase [Deltaproteobacteria bacterium]
MGTVAALRQPLLVALLFLSPATALAAPPGKVPAKKPAPTAQAHPPAKAHNLQNTSGKHGSTARVAPPAAPARQAPARSVGSPTDGHLLGGAHLADAPYLRVYPAYSGGDVRWGLDGLVGLVDRAAKNVRKQFPDAVLSVGHLSKKGGGELDRHASHESGRDADIGFYVKNSAGKPIYADHMVAFEGDGTAKSWPGAHFDDARNWALVASIVGDGHVRVTHIFVATPIRERLLAYAGKIGASPAIRNRAAEVLAQPHGALPHDDHFHVRIACPPGMEQCIEQPVAKAHSRHGSAVASHHGHPAHPSAAGAHASSHAESSTAGRAKPHASSRASGDPHAAPPAAPKPSAPKKDEEDKSEALIPSLAPAIPGLDAAVIPAPLAGARSTWGTSKDPAPAPKADPISDPDGVLDRH